MKNNMMNIKKQNNNSNTSFNFYQLSKKMKNLICISLSFLILCAFHSDLKNSDEIKSKLIKLLDEKRNSEYTFEIIYKDVMSQDSSIMGLPFCRLNKAEELVSFCNKNKKEVFPILIEFLKHDKYDWIADLLLHQITEQDMFGLVKFKPNLYQEWRKEAKNREISFWSNYTLE